MLFIAHSCGLSQGKTIEVSKTGRFPHKNMPYIPEEHKKYNVLPYSVEHGGEVFCYPSELVDEIESYYPEGDSFIPYGYESYEEYFDYLDEYESEATDPHLIDLFEELKKEILQTNKKEEWSICRYVGPEMSTVKGLEPGQCYYWPCCADDPEYAGVIDNEEFTSYWYPTNPELWEIVVDPTGMALDTITNTTEDNSKEQFNGVMNCLNGDDWTDI